ncbi:unnamed protein product [Owenia fusiformis]|uniref:Uncharacterized protein n=1 Tax=Owenia fusiformis TaxID=6347 RepID=A0A8J1TT17_OWEFU|nr:unnamed protein product [Owenia fusiformis]
MSSNTSEAQDGEPSTTEVTPLAKEMEGSGDQNPSTDQVYLKRQLGLLSCTSYIVGGIIGTGIFVSPKGILRESGSVGLALVLWAVSGVISFLGALCFAELGLTIRSSGGSYTYVKKAYGDLAGFIFIWLEQFVRQPASQALRALAVGHYLAQPIYPTCVPPYFATRLIGAVVFCLITLINCVRVSWGSMFQVVTTLGKLLALGTIVCAGMYALSQGGTKRFENSFEGSTSSVGGLVMSIYYGLYAYAGWENMNYATEEIKNVKRTLPYSIVIGLVIVTLTYILVNVSYLAVLSPEELISVDAVAVTFSQRMLGAAHYLMPVCVAISIIGSLNASILGCSRVYYVGAREGHLPTLLSMLHIKRLTPVPALLLNCALTIALLCAPSLTSLLDYYVLIRWGLLSIATSTILYFRWKLPDIPRPLKIPLVIPITFLIACAFLVGVAFYREPINCLISIGIGAIGIPVYLILVAVKKKPQIIYKAIDTVTVFCQKLLMCVLPDGFIDSV